MNKMKELVGMNYLIYLNCKKSENFHLSHF